MQGRIHGRVLLLVIITLLWADRAAAQWAGNGFLNINGGFQPGDRSVTDTIEAPLFDETAVYDATSSSSEGTVLDASAGVRVWRGLAVGLGVTMFEVRSSMEVSGSIPSPLFVNRPRNAQFQQGGLTHRQLGIHLHMTYIFPVTDRIDVAVSAGPSLFRMRQDSPLAVALGAETAPFNTVTIASVATATARATGFGGNAGLDVTYMLTRFIGAGIFVRYMGGPIDFGGESVDAGGAQAGGGLRFRF